MIAIIAILAAILFPVFARARENARKASCQSNLKQIGLGFAQYVQDNDGIYPIDNYFTTQGPIGWAQTVQPYLKSIQIYQCPSESQPQNPYIKDISTGATSYLWFDYTDYFYNQNFAYSSQDASGAYGTGALNQKSVRDSQLAGASQTVLLGDYDNYFQGSISLEPDPYTSTKYVYNSNGEYVSGTPIAGSPMAMQRHLDGANYAFADGHVKWLKHSSISRGYAGYYSLTAANYSKPYPDTGGIKNALPPGKLTAPYSATFSPVDY